MEMSEDTYANSGIATNKKYDYSDGYNPYEDIYVNEDSFKTHRRRDSKESGKPGTVKYFA